MMDDWRKEMAEIDQKRKEMMLSLRAEGYTDKQISSIFNKHISDVQAIMNS